MVSRLALSSPDQWFKHGTSNLPMTMCTDYQEDKTCVDVGIGLTVGVSVTCKCPM